MSHFAALPFYLRRSDDVIGEQGITSTAETVHGLMRLDGECLVIQWRVARETDHVGREIRTDHVFEPVQEVVVALAGLAAAAVRTPWWPFRRSARLVLTAADLRTFEEVAGAGALRLKHPAELIVRIRRSDRAAAQEFAGELELALAEQELRAAEVPVGLANAGNLRQRIPAPGADPSGAA